MKVFSYSKRIILCACLTFIFGFAPITVAQAPSTLQSMEQHLHTTIQAYYNIDAPESHHGANSNTIQQFAANLANASSPDDLDAYTRTFFITYTADDIASFQDLLYVFIGSLVAPTVTGLSSYALADNLINPKLYRLSQHVALEKQAQLLLHDPVMFNKYMSSKKNLFNNLDEVLHHLIDGPFFIHQEAGAYILGLKSTKEKIILNKQRFAKLLSNLLLTPKDEVHAATSIYFKQVQHGKSALKELAQSNIRSITRLRTPTSSTKAPVSAVPTPKKIYTFLPRAIACTVAVSTLLWMENAVFTNKIDPDANPGMFELSSLDSFLHQFSQVVQSHDPAGLQSLLDQYPILTAILAMEITDIPRAIAQYRTTVANL